MINHHQAVAGDWCQRASGQRQRRAESGDRSRALAHSLDISLSRTRSSGGRAQAEGALMPAPKAQAKSSDPRGTTGEGAHGTRARPAGRRGDRWTAPRGWFGPALMFSRSASGTHRYNPEKSREAVERRGRELQAEHEHGRGRGSVPSEGTGDLANLPRVGRAKPASSTRQPQTSPPSGAGGRNPRDQAEPVERDRRILQVRLL